MARHRGGKKRVGKKPGRKSKGFYAAEKFKKIADGQCNNNGGQWRSISQVNLDSKIRHQYEKHAAQCGERTARNEWNRERKKD